MVNTDTINGTNTVNTVYYCNSCYERLPCGICKITKQMCYKIGVPLTYTTTTATSNTINNTNDCIN